MVVSALMNSLEVRFGRFRLDLGEQRLLREDRPVRLAGRALDILCALAAAEGGVVTKDELMRRLWPGRAVEENNLHVHVSALRKALDADKGGDSHVVTVPSRGYRLVGLQDPASARSVAQPLTLPDKPSIAVLPSANRSGDPEQEYLVY